MTNSANPFAGSDIRTLIDHQARVRGDQTFLIWSPSDDAEQTWTYTEFTRDVRRCAAALHRRGVRPGDRVLVHAQNSAEMMIAWLGCAYAGAVAVTTNAASSADELSYFAEHSGVVGAFASVDLADVAASSLPPTAWLTPIDGAASAFPAFLAGEDALPPRPHNENATFAIQYTSGTTSRPKAVVWTHSNALWGARQSAAHEGLHASDRHLTCLPLFHTNAQSYSVLAALWAGASVVLLPKFSASRFWPVSVRHRCTWSSLVPFCVSALMATPLPESHAYRMWGGAFCDPATDRHFGIRTLGWWGMTETITHGTVGSNVFPDASMSIGRPAPGYEVFVLNNELKPVEPGETGDLFVRGARGLSLFAEYANDPEATRAAFTPDGLFATGDRVRLGEDGYLYFADRSKDMLKVAGENVAASEVERVILEVRGVREAAVVGRQDPMRGELPVAFVVTDVTDTFALEAAVLEHCRAKLAKFKVPAEVRFIDTLPRATLSKVSKVELRRILTSG